MSENDRTKCQKMTEQNSRKRPNEKLENDRMK